MTRVDVLRLEPGCWVTFELDDVGSGGRGEVLAIDLEHDLITLDVDDQEVVVGARDIRSVMPPVDEDRIVKALGHPVGRPPTAKRRRDGLAENMTAFELTVKDVLLVLMADQQLHPETTMEELVETAMNTADTLFDALEADS
ncbi:MAG: hypothetical protein H0X64_04735 [Gemmatimonadaceae bacterium]|nr:hypothetical protein [Gemmatimonadaceae bacterium]